MTFKEILDNYPKQDFPNHGLSAQVFKILKLLAEKEEEDKNLPAKSVKCELCKFQPKEDEFVSECWLQIPYSVDGGEHGTIIWVCPDCIAKKANVN